MPTLPSGTVTFVFSDIEGSTNLLKRLGDARYAEALATHRRMLRELFGAHGGQEIDTQGDAFFYSFTRARQAVAAAVEVQLAHEREPWPQEARVRIRLGLHTGEPAVGDEGYTGLDVVRASRIAATGRGGQVLLSETTRAIVADDLPDGVTMVSLGERALRDIDRPEPLSELLIPGVEVSEQSAAQPTADWAGPPAADMLPAGVPDWVRDAATGFGLAAQGTGHRTQELVEGRVLSLLTEAFARRDARRGARRDQERGGPPAPTDPPTEAGSVAGEIERLRALRDAGALSPDQYDRAVDRVLSKDG